MSYAAKVIGDSISPDGVRLTTMQITFPRFVLAEFNTHRVMSRSSASSRAIPVEKRCDEIAADPFVPAAFAKNKRGMQAGERLDDYEQQYAAEQWIDASRDAVSRARNMACAGIHKQWANRLIEPFAWHTVIVTATDWRNFFALRCSPMAQPEIREIADRMKVAMDQSEPYCIDFGGWHLPLVRDVDAVDIVISYDILTAARISAARCARVSYLTHEGKRDVAADLALADRLASDGHMSPFEHAARPATREDLYEQAGRWGIAGGHGGLYEDDDWPRKFPFGNLRGWCSLRWTMPGEAVFGGGDP